MTETSNTNTGVDWTDQVRAVAQFIGDHELPVISIDARPRPTSYHDDAHVSVHIQPRDWLTWWPAVERILDEHTERYNHLPKSDFHYVVGLVAGVRVQLLYITDVEQEVTSHG